jgi:type II secretory ATPase GspE/PulE/Tfp pilus assembly ATPase PilB-like protein
MKLLSNLFDKIKKQKNNEENIENEEIFDTGSEEEHSEYVMEENIEKEKKNSLGNFLRKIQRNKKENKEETAEEIHFIQSNVSIEDIIGKLPISGGKKAELMDLYEKLPKNWRELLEELIEEFQLGYRDADEILNSSIKAGISPILYLTQILRLITEDELFDFYQKKYGIKVDKLFSPSSAVRKLNYPYRRAFYLIGEGSYSSSEIGLYSPLDFEFVIRDLGQIFLNKKKSDEELKVLESLNLENLEIVIVSARLFENKSIVKEREVESSQDLRQKFKTIIKTAMQNDVSDIHFSPKQSFVEVKVRLYGDLVPFMHLTHPEWQAMMRVIKTMASESGSVIDVNEWRIGQDAKATIPEFNVDLRLAFTPSLIEKEQYLVIRILYRGKEIRVKKGEEVKVIKNLGYFDEDAEFLSEYIITKEKGQGGILIMSGATASGKSMTLNSMLALVPPKRAIKTVEDPVEYRLPNADQHEVSEFTKGNQTIEFGFLQAVKEFMRQDPDIIFIGEWRKDKELTSALTYASKTGHFVLTTLHSSRVVNIPDLLYSDYEVDKPTQANNISLLISQRLLKTVCPNCSLVEPVKYTNLTMEIDKIPFLDRDKLFRIFDVFRSENIKIGIKNYIGNLKENVYVEEISIRKLFISLAKQQSLMNFYLDIEIPKSYEKPIEKFNEIALTKRLHQITNIEKYKEILKGILTEEISKLGRVLEKFTKLENGEISIKEITEEDREIYEFWKNLIEEKEFNMDAKITQKIKEKMEKGQTFFRVINLKRLWKYYFEYAIENNPKIRNLREMVIYYSPKVNERGCEQCIKRNPITNQIISAGIKGRTPIYEYLIADTDFRETIFKTTEALEIEKLLNRKNREYIRTKSGKLFAKGKSFIDTFTEKLIGNYKWNIPLSEIVKLKQ